jgi:hypothetical protein
MTIFIRWRRASKLRILRARGRACMAAYLRVIDALEYDPFTAEAICPSLLRHKRRAKACVRLSLRLKSNL